MTTGEIISVIVILALLWAGNLYGGDRLYTIRVGAFKNRQNALKMVDTLKKAELPAVLKTEERKSSTWHMAYIGQFESLQEAKEQARGLVQTGRITDYVITRISPKPDTATQTKASVESVSPKPETAREMVIEAIEFKADAPGKETLLIRSKAPLYPAVRFNLQAQESQLVVEVEDVTNVTGPLASQAVEGEWIKRIRSDFSQDQKTFRILIDLHPQPDYQVTQICSSDQNCYILTIFKQTEAI